MKFFISLFLCNALALMTAIADAPTQGEITMGRFASDLIQIANKYSNSGDNTGLLFSGLISVNKEAALEISTFWRTQADVELKDFLHDKYRELDKAEYSANERINSIRAAYQGYYFRNWDKIRGAIDRRMLPKPAVLSSVSKADSQYGMTQDALGEYAQIDKELQKVYDEVIKIYSDNPEFISAFKTSQRAWLAFRDAHIKAIWPSDNIGTAERMALVYELSNVTKARLVQVKTWRDGIEEGDISGGSRRTTYSIQSKSR